jgi:uncharacterized membrane protein
MKIFGREPAALIGVLEGILAFALTLNVFGLTADSIGAIMAVVVAAFGLYSAYVTRDTLLGVAIGLAKAVIALFAAYGLPLSPDKTGALIALITVVFGLFQRTQTDPLVTPTFKYEPVSV